MKEEYEGIQKEVVATYFKILFRKLPGESEENKESIHSVWLLVEADASRIQARHLTA
jgi:hypothetical protein